MYGRRQLSMNLAAAHKSPLTSKDTTPPKPFMYFFATSWSGCEGKAGVVNLLDHRVLLQRRRQLHHAFSLCLSTRS